ncbi:exodeoxyribonuclease VII large subunit [Heliorestis acidaminivorans]|uniref:Exodeoxyribonuclease 7 large subunit n=1 Tax=Heliorestis acidaminivorans TaxID=553427 RepID=A0A6I0EX17_9FIRM|nr:exodeoxyribonuclease VII large subunit [Heliorestis acidaminivorans]KAB2951683.1 exodeoxyribonuclease VII large subunit [Heliorestis acidaminivorans]
MNKVWSITELNQYIEGLLSEEETLQDIWVQGELSNFKHHSSGHMYFTLKDREGTLKALMFRGRARFLKFRPENGLQVVIRGRIAVYARDGVYQLYAEEMEPAGLGGIYLALEQVRQRLEADGLFASERKRPLPFLPRAVGIVTAPTGAAIRDLYAVITRRYPKMNIFLAPAMVQGEEAPESLIKALEKMRNHPLVDVVIIGRGGGSREDLWAFNDEQLCRVIADFPIPVISAVGHESDVSLSDLVADVRAATPSAAAELAVPVYDSLKIQCNDLEERLRRAMHSQISSSRQAVTSLEKRPVLANPLQNLRIQQQRVDQLEERLLRNSERAIIAQKAKQVQDLEARLLAHVQGRRTEQMAQRVDELRHRLIYQANQKLLKKRSEIAMQAGLLDALSPLAVLDRGFALCLNEKEEVLRDAEQVSPGESIHITLRKGEVTCKVEERKVTSRWQINQKKS